MMMMMMMSGGTLTSSSSTKIILEAFPAEIFRRGGARVEISTRKTFQLKLLRVDSVHSRILKPIPPRSSSSKVIEPSREEEEAESEAVEKSPGRRRVRVRFQLRKECVFGEHFFILGDHPVFGGGLWDPQNALPLNWADGHVWTIDLDLPVGRLVEFKFILKAKTGEILWQPGPNRSFETWETNKTIRICEDWENADLQMTMEEEDKLSSLILDIPLVAENVTHPKQSVTSVSSNGAGEEVEVLPPPIQQITSVVSDDEPEENENSNSDIPMESSSGALSACDEAMFTEEESPVLVPGLFPPSDLDSEEVIHREVINEGKTETFPEVDKEQEIKGERNDKGKVKAVSVLEKSEQEAVKGAEKKHYNAAEEEVQQQGLETEALGTPHVLLENDIQWGRRELYKLLSNFGLF